MQPIFSKSAQEGVPFDHSPFKIRLYFAGEGLPVRRIKVRVVGFDRDDVVVNHGCAIKSNSSAP